MLPELSDLLAGQLQVLASRHQLAISLSAGLDSRTTLAISRPVADQALYFTYVIEDSPDFSRDVLETDARVATELAQNLRLRHTVLRVKGAPDSALLPVFQANSFLAHSYALASAYLHQLPPGMLHVRSNLTAIGRAFYRRGRARELPLTPARMAETWAPAAGANRGAVEAFEQFAQTVSFGDLCDYDPYDIFYWEHRGATWHTCILLESDIAFDSFLIYNCRRVLNLLLSVPLADRIRATLFHELIRRHWPVLHFWPINRVREDYSLWETEAEEFLDLRGAEVRGGSLNDPAAAVPVTVERGVRSVRFHMDRSDPRQGDYASFRLSLQHAPDVPQRLLVRVQSPYCRPQNAGYLAYQVLLNGTVLLEEDVAHWDAVNYVEILWVPKESQSLLEVRVVALRNCPPWQWGRAAEIRVHGVSQRRARWTGKLRVAPTSPYSRVAPGFQP